MGRLVTDSKVWRPDRIGQRETEGTSMNLAVKALSVVVFSLGSLAITPAAFATVNYNPIISGHVYDADGNPLAGIQVREGLIPASSISDSWLEGSTADEATTDASGYYEIQDPYPLSAATLQFHDPSTQNFATEFLGGGMTSTSAVTFVVPEYTDVTAPDMVMHPGGSIAGTITEPDGSASTYFGLQVWQQDSSGVWRIVDEAQMEESGAGFGSGSSTVKIGEDFTETGYLETGLLPGAYRLCASTDISMPQCVGNAVSPGTSTPVTVTSGATTTQDFSMSKGGSLSGQFLNDAGVTYSWGTASVFYFNPDTGEWDPTGMRSAMSGGPTYNWNISYLRPGEYKVYTSFGDLSNGFYPNLTDIDHATIYKVVDGRVTSGLDMDVQTPGGPPLTSAPSPSSTPSITGTVKVGSTLVAHAGYWPAPVAPSYQWYAGGIAIPSATNVSLVVPVSAYGAQITVKVTRPTGGANSVLTSPPTAPAGSGVFTTTPSPTISGTVAVGAVLSAHAGTWGPVPAALTYQWDINGAALAGATSSTFRPAAAQLGKHVSVVVTGRATGFTSRTVSSALSLAVARGTLVSHKPTISGTVKVGYILTAHPGLWTSGRIILYHWFANNVAITNATGGRFKLTRAQRGRNITVRAVGSKAGYTTVTIFSAATAKVH
jgi:hypothetical protein